MIEAFARTSARSRRDLFRSIGVLALGGGSVAVLGACSSGEPSGGSSSAASAGPISVPKADVPQGGGVIQGSYVVTQPNAGEFKAFSSTCTHEGCPVSKITEGKIICNCHGSEFSITDGSVMNGPADKPLAEASVTASGDSLDVSG